MTTIQELNKIPVTAELLAAALDLHATMDPKDRAHEGSGMFRLFRLLDSKGLRKNRGVTAFAIELRLAALDELKEDKTLHAWILPGAEQGFDYIHNDLLAAAAKAPLVLNKKKQVAFEPISFRKLVLTISETKGVA